eukprot:15285641-Heterocapsa_arctica.AAC.1
MSLSPLVLGLTVVVASSGKVSLILDLVDDLCLDSTLVPRTLRIQRLAPRRLPEHGRRPPWHSSPSSSTGPMFHHSAHLRRISLDWRLHRRHLQEHTLHLPMSPWRDSKSLDLEVIDVELSSCGASVQAGHRTVVSDLTSQ